MDTQTRSSQRRLMLKAQLEEPARQRLLGAASTFEWLVLDEMPVIAVPFGRHAAFRTVVELADFLLGLMPEAFARLLAAWPKAGPASPSTLAWQPVHALLPRDTDAVREAILKMPISTRVEPIVELDTGDLFGFGCSTSAEIDGRSLAWPELSTWASQHQLLCTLDRRCNREHMRHAAEHGLLDRDGTEQIVLSVESGTLRLADLCLTDLLDSAARIGVEPDRIVVLLDMPGSHGEMDRLEHIARDLHRCGLSIGLRCPAEGFAELEAIRMTGPELLRLTPAAAARTAWSPLQQAVLDQVIEYGRSTGTRLLAPHLQCAQALRSARKLGATLGQGMFELDAGALHLGD